MQRNDCVANAIRTLEYFIDGSDIRSVDTFLDEFSWERLEDDSDSAAQLSDISHAIGVLEGYAEARNTSSVELCREYYATKETQTDER